MINRYLCHHHFDLLCPHLCCLNNVKRVLCSQFSEIFSDRKAKIRLIVYSSSFSQSLIDFMDTQDNATSWINLPA